MESAPGVQRRNPIRWRLRMTRELRAIRACPNRCQAILVLVTTPQAVPLEIQWNRPGLSKSQLLGQGGDTASTSDPSAARFDLIYLLMRPTASCGPAVASRTGRWYWGDQELLPTDASGGMSYSRSVRGSAELRPPASRPLQSRNPKVQQVHCAPIREGGNYGYASSSRCSGGGGRGPDHRAVGSRHRWRPRHGSGCIYSQTFLGLHRFWECRCGQRSRPR